MSRLAGDGLTDEKASAWLQTWELIARQRGIPHEADYWTRAWEWISAERNAGRRP
jgi:hypothetical protein